MTSAGSITLVAGDPTGYDLEGAQPSQLAAAFARYGEVVERAVHRYGGIRPPVGTKGDYFLAVFQSALDATRASLDIHLAAQAGPPCVVPRIAVHTGVTTKRDDGTYVGRAVDRCDQIRRRAHAGQILVSPATHELVVGDPTIDFTFREVSNEGRDSTVGRIYQLCHPGLPDKAPAPEASVVSGSHVSEWDLLTTIEGQVVDLVAEGFTNPQIGARLGLSPRTVQAHLARIFRKLDVTSRSQLAARAARAER